MTRYFISFRWVCFSLVVFIWFSGFISSAAAQISRPDHSAERLTPEQWAALEKSLQESLREQEHKLLDFKTRLVQEKESLFTLRQATGELGAALSAHQANLAVAKLPLVQARELTEEYQQRREKVSITIKKLDEELTGIAAQQEQAVTSLADFKIQVERLKKASPLAGLGDRLIALSQKYNKVAVASQNQLAQVQEFLNLRLQELRRQHELLDQAVTALQQYVDKTFKDQLLKRQEESSPKEDLYLFLKESLLQPERLLSWFQQGLQSGSFRAFLVRHAAPLVGLILFLGLLLLAAGHLRRLLRRSMALYAERAESFSLKTLLALGRVILKNLSLLTLTLWTGLTLWTLKLGESTAALILFYGLLAGTAIRLGQALSSALFHPQDPGRGIITVGPATSRFYRRTLTGFVIYFCVARWGLETLHLLTFPSNTILFVSSFYLVGILLGFAVLLRKPHLENLLEGLNLGPSSWRGSLLKALRPLVLLLLSAIIVSQLLGFQYLSLFLSNAAANTALLAVGFWLLSQMTVDFNQYLNHPTTGLLARKFALAPETLQRTYQLFPRFCHGVLVLGFVLATLNFWGVKPHWLYTFLAALDTGLILGPVKLSFISLLLAAASILLSRRLARFIIFMLERGLYHRAGWDPGIQHTISATVTYSLIILGIVLALSFLGLNLTNLALVAGALGVGIGFGLQNIVNNFVSGLILLFERPIKVGDMLVIDGQWGLVKTIRVRSTIFETFDRYVMIIPNSDLISNKIINWTHYGRGPNRLTLNVGVAYGSDVHAVTRLIDSVCRANRRVLHNPPPQVYFAAYGDSSLDFTIMVHVRLPEDRIPATHEINTAMYEALQAAGIQIPFPQRDLHIHTIAPWPLPMSADSPTPSNQDS